MSSRLRGFEAEDSPQILHEISKPNRLPHQDQPSPHRDGSNASRGARTGRCETLERDRDHDDRHRAQLHEPDHEQDRGQAGAGGDAVQAEAQAVAQRRGGVRRQTALRAPAGNSPDDAASTP